MTHLLGVITTIISSDEEIKQMNNIAAELGINIELIDPSFLMEPATIDDNKEDDMRLQLEELFQLVESSPAAAF